MRLTELTITGLKGHTIHLDGLTGRDVLKGRAMAGKSTSVQGLTFLLTGSIPEVKRDDLITLAPGGFTVASAWERDDWTTVGISRTLVVKTTKAGAVKTTQEMAFTPSMGEKKLAEWNERLETEFAGTSLAFFDVRAFMEGSDTERLKALVDVAGEPEDVDLPAFVGARKAPESVDAVAFEGIRNEILGLPLREGCGPLDAVTRYEVAVKDWTSDARKERDRAIEAVREMAAGATTVGGNVESLEAEEAKLQAEVEEILTEKAAADERRRQVEKAEEERGAATDDLAAAKRKLNALDSSALDAVLADEEAAVEGLTKKAAAWEVDEKAEVEKLRKDLERLEGERAGPHTRIQEVMAELLDVRGPMSEARSALRQAQHEVEQAEKDVVDWEDLHGKACPMCEQEIQEGAHARLMDSLALRVEDRERTAKEAADGLESIEKKKVDLTKERDTLAMKVNEITPAIEAIQEKLEARPANPYEAPLEEATRSAGRTRELVESFAKDVEAAEAAVTAARDTLDGVNRRITSLVEQVPAEFEEDLLSAAKATRDAARDRVNEARDAARRAADQEKERAKLATQEKRYDASKAWEEHLKAVKGEILATTLGAALRPAESLTADALKGYTLTARWEDPRGRPGLRLALVDPERKVTEWPGMSGTQRVIIGMALALSVASAKAPPCVLTADLDPLDSEAMVSTLKALDAMGGPVTGLLLTTHHVEAVMPDPWAEFVLKPRYPAGGATG